MKSVGTSKSQKPMSSGGSKSVGGIKTAFVDRIVTGKK